MQSLFFAYEVRLPLGASKAKSIWNGVIEKIECRLTSWKRLYLSEGGGITLIKSSLSICLPTFCLCFLSQLALPIISISCNGISYGKVGEIRLNFT
jgi:hypothetical protein